MYDKEVYEDSITYMGYYNGSIDIPVYCTPRILPFKKNNEYILSIFGKRKIYFIYCSLTNNLTICIFIKNNFD